MSSSRRSEKLARAAMVGVVAALLAGCVEDAKPPQDAKTSGATNAPKHDRERAEKGGCGKAGCG